jgi:hypothetical protein
VRRIISQYVSQTAFGWGRKRLTKLLVMASEIIVSPDIQIHYTDDVLQDIYVSRIAGDTRAHCKTPCAHGESAIAGARAKEEEGERADQFYEGFMYILS